MTFLYRYAEERLPASTIPDPLPNEPDWNSAYEDFVMSGKCKSREYKYMSMDSCWSNEIFYYDYNESFLGSLSDLNVMLYDMDRDGTPELIISNGYRGALDSGEYVYTYVDAKVKYIGNSRGNEYISNSKFSGTWSGWGGAWADGWAYFYFSKVGNQMKCERVCSQDFATGKETPYNMDLYSASKLPKDRIPFKTIGEIKSMGWDAFVRESGV